MRLFSAMLLAVALVASATLLKVETAYAGPGSKKVTGVVLLDCHKQGPNWIVVSAERKPNDLAPGRGTSCPVGLNALADDYCYVKYTVDQSRQGRNVLYTLFCYY